MAYQPNPNDPFQPNSVLDEQISDRQTRLDNEMQVDPELAEGPASGGRIAMYALAVALVLGAVFYGLNNTSIESGRHGQTAQNGRQPDHGTDFAPQLRGHARRDAAQQHRARHDSGRSAGRP